MTYTWLMIFIVLVIIELSTVNLVSVWFALGAIAAFLVSFLIDDITIQISVFVAVSFITLLLTKKFVKRIRGREPEPTNLDRVVGKEGIVTEEITKLQPGEVKVDGKKWSALATKKIVVGKKVEVLSIDGVKLNVKEIKEGSDD